MRQFTTPNLGGENGAFRYLLGLELVLRAGAVEPKYSHKEATHNEVNDKKARDGSRYQR
jgi:hypothetical protein